MSEYVGRTGGRRVYSYPPTPSAAAAALALFARNLGTGPKHDQDVGADGVVVLWNSVDVMSQKFTIDAGGTTMSVAGDMTSVYTDGDTISITPTTPVPDATTTRTISGVAFAAGFTTWTIDSDIDSTTTGGTVSDGAPGATPDVPITPRSSGVVLVSGVLTIANTSGGDVLATVTVHVDGVAVPSGTFAAATVLDTDEIAIPFMAEALIPVGETHNIEVFVDGDGVTLVEDGSVVNVQEVPASTG